MGSTFVTFIGIKAAYYSRITNHTVWYQAGYPKRPSDFLHKLELKCMSKVYQTAPHEPVYSVVFQEPFKDRTKLQGRRRGRQIAHWVETTAKRHFGDIYDHSASGHSIFRPHFKYALIPRHFRVLEPTSMRTNQHAGPQQKMGVFCTIIVEDRPPGIASYLDSSFTCSSAYGLDRKP